MNEIQIVEGCPKNIQKLLNQWRRQSDLVIHGQFAFYNPEIKNTWCVLTIEIKPKGE